VKLPGWEKIAQILAQTWEGPWKPQDS
jgi:hypothetical protein